MAAASGKNGLGTTFGAGSVAEGGKNSGVVLHEFWLVLGSAPQSCSLVLFEKTFWGALLGGILSFWGARPLKTVVRDDVTMTSQGRGNDVIVVDGVVDDVMQRTGRA